MERVNSLHDLTNFIVPHFVNYPLLSQKGADFYLFKQIINLINTKVHLTAMGLQEIINIRASMNSGLSDLQKSKFTTYNPVPRPNFNFTEIPNPNWIAGFASGEGCFLCTISIAKATNNNKIGYITQLVFKISQHSRDKKVLELIANFMNCGGIYSHSENAFVFQVTKFADIQNKIIPIFKVHLIQGIKQLDYQDFCQIATLISEDKHLSPKGLDGIRFIKDRMNTKRKDPKI